MSDATDAPEPARPQRPARLTLTQSVLALQALGALFAVLVLWGLGRTDMVDVPAWLTWGGGLGLVVLLAFAAGRQDRRWGTWLGWALQAPMLVAGLIEPTIAIIGAMFLALWVTALRLGGRIDRERAERLAAGDDATAGDDAAETAAPGAPGDEAGRDR
ncbi:DUF4233 domain-containing protein [Demequina pelophila]|uniref:DUF4233 domain-containing protein n=1 Tax=Demequina pelophila TaxID=1638984 RepID=UPI0007844ED1|nr:DUF4233 domain-containing protein [Demequina pelophila]